MFGCHQISPLYTTILAARKLATFKKPTQREWSVIAHLSPQDLGSLVVDVSDFPTFVNLLADAAEHRDIRLKGEVV